jgi:hypothetical protein
LRLWQAGTPRATHRASSSRSGAAPGRPTGRCRRPAHPAGGIRQPPAGGCAFPGRVKLVPSEALYRTT